MHLRSIICFNRFFPNRAGPLMGYFKSNDSCGVLSYHLQNQLVIFFQINGGLQKIINHSDNSCFNIVLVLSLLPSLSMKILSINNFTIKLLSKLLSDLSIGSLIRSLVVKLSIDNIYIDRLRLSHKHFQAQDLQQALLISDTQLKYRASNIHR